MEMRMPGRRCFLPWWLVIGVLFPVWLSGQVKSEAPAQEKFVGAWRLVSIETIRPNGEVIYPFYGKHPEGLIMYDRSGWMSVQIVSDPAPAVPASSSREGMLTAAAAEKVKAFEGYYAYCGTWTVDVGNATVTHHIRQTLYPGERGQDYVRHFVLDGNRLILTAKTHEMGEDHERKLVWQRAGPEQP
jgi:hypothetical protein